MSPNFNLSLSVLGLGHVGLPTAVGLAELGWEVTGADYDESKIERLIRGDVPFFEPGLQELLSKHLDSGRLRFVPSAEIAIQNSTVLFVCVGTPQKADGSADLEQLDQIGQTIARNLNKYKLIVEKSTAPVNTAQQLKKAISRYSNNEHPYDVAVNPEFLREGTALSDFLNPDRIVIGVESKQAKELLVRIYQPLFHSETHEPSDSTVNTNHGDHMVEQHDDLQLCGGNSPVSSKMLVTDLNTAELIKHASNSFLAMKVSFINMMSDLCEAAGADVTHVANGIGLDHRIGPEFLKAGAGYGGYCLAKDTRALALAAEDYRIDANLLRAVDEVNEARIDILLQKVQNALWVIRGKEIGIWGLAFKPGTDDLREAPSLKLIARLREEGANLRLHDPEAMENLRDYVPELEGKIRYSTSAYDAAKGAHALVLMTEWKEYELVDLDKVHRSMQVPLIIDGRNLYDPTLVRGFGFEYHSMGRL